MKIIKGIEYLTKEDIENVLKNDYALDYLYNTERCYLRSRIRIMQMLGKLPKKLTKDQFARVKSLCPENYIHALEEALIVKRME